MRRGARIRQRAKKVVSTGNTRDVPERSTQTRKITERKRIEEALLESEVRFRKLFEQSPIIMPYIKKAFSGEALDVPAVLYVPVAYGKPMVVGRERWTASFMYPIKDAQDQVREVVALHEEIVNAHGGTIRVESRPGHGSTFIVMLPLKKAGVC